MIRLTSMIARVRGIGLSVEGSCMLVAAILILLLPVQGYGLPYYTVGTIRVSLHEYDTVERSSGLQSTTSIADGESLLGSAGQYAEAMYYGDLSTGTVGAYVYAVNGFDGKRWWQSSASTTVKIFDTLSFTIPAGDYPEGVAVTATGHVEGTRWDSALGQSRFSFEASLGNAYYSLRQDIGLSEPHYDVYSEDFTLTDWIFLPGTHLSEDTVRVRDVVISLGLPASLVASTGGDYLGVETFAGVDFYNTGSFYSLSVPTGVTWTSASGVFLVPEPISSILFVTGGATLAFRRYMKRKKRA